MKTLIKIILLILITGAGIFIISYPGVWKFRVENILNRKILRDSGWELSIGELKGHLLKQIESRDIEITHENGSKIFIPVLNVQFNVMESLFGNLHLKELEIYDFNFLSPDRNGIEKKVLILPDLDYGKFPLTIDYLSFDGILTIALSDTVHRLDLNIHSVINPNEEGLDIFIDKLFAKHPDIDYNIKLNNTKINIDNRVITVDSINGSIADLLFNGNLVFKQSENQQLNGKINFSNVNISKNYTDKIPFNIDLSNLSTEIIFDTNFENYSGRLSIDNDKGIEMDCDFNISKIEDQWIAQQILLHSKDTNFKVQGDLIDNKINADIELDGLDLSEWLTEQRTTNITGIVRVNSIIDSGYIKFSTFDMEIEELALFVNDTLYLNGSFGYNNNKISFAKPFNVKVGSSSITTLGNIDFNEKELDLSLVLNKANASLINNFLNDSLESCLVSGNLNVTGQFDDPVIVGEINGEDIQYKDIYLSEINLVGEYNRESEIIGTSKVKFGNGNWKDILFEQGNADIVFKNHNTYLTNITITNGEAYFTGSGSFDNKSNFYVDDLKTFYNGHLFKNKTPFSFSYIDKHFSISQFSADFDDGTIEGEITFDKILVGKILFSNIDANILHPLIKNERYRFNGQLFGQLDLNELSGRQNYSIDVMVKNGAFNDVKFEQLKALMNYNNQKLNITELVLKENDKYHLDIKATVPFGEPNPTENMLVLANFYNTNVKTITQFLPDWFEIDGIINGELNINGTRKNMISNFDVKVSDTNFDKISLGNVQVRGNFDGERLNFNSFASDLNDNHFTGYGYLPIDLNMESDSFGHFIDKDSIYFFVEGVSKDLQFISNYFEEVDKAPGDYIIALELSGLWENIIRNGRLTANNANVYTPLLDDPIRGLHGFAHIDNNRLIIDDMHGKMYRTGKRNKLPNDNVSISGSMDMSSFFDPYINIKSIGKEVYFRSLLYEIEGVADFNINVTGRDTILISGQVAPIDVEMFQSLTTSELGVLPSKEGSTIIHYKIDFPIKGKLTLTNDQLNVVLIGAVSINQFGDREMDFAGELIIDEGEFYYYGDIFTITEGYLTFDNHGFNPYLDITANTTIDREQIDISMIGPINNPKLTFTSESGFSQSDILELLTWRKRFESQDISSTGIGYQASDIALSWFGSQLDKNILELSGLKRLGILENVDVHGTSGLITAGTDFSISTPLTDKFSVNYAYRRSFGLDESSHSVGIELRINRNLSLVGNIDRNGYMAIKYRLRFAY